MSSCQQLASMLSSSILISMKTIAIINRKGGVGKTEFAVCLSVEAERNGITTLVLDADSQGSVYKWGKRREASTPVVKTAQPIQIPELLEIGREAGAKLAIIDTAGLAENSSLQIARMSDLVLIPTGPSIRDLEAFTTALDIATLAKKPHVVVLNRLHPNSMRKFAEIRKYLEQQFDANVFPSYMSSRQSHQDSDLDGLAPQEFDEVNTAREVRAIYNGLASMLADQHANMSAVNRIEEVEI